MKILIIEDEKYTAKDLANSLLNINPKIVILEIIESVSYGIEYLKNNEQVDLIFSDIQLVDGLSFEIFEATKNNIPIVFCTAYDEFALKAFEASGIEYILKPFKTEAIEQALKKYETLKQQFLQPNISELLNLVRQGNNEKQQNLLVHRGSQIIPLNINEIALFIVENSLVFVYTFDDKKYLLNQTMNELEEKYTPDFFRVNRQFLVNRTAVKHATQAENRKLKIHLKVEFKEEILVPKPKIPQFINWLATA